MKYIFIFLIVLFSFQINLQGQLPADQPLRTDDVDLQKKSADDKSSKVFDPQKEYKYLKRDIGYNYDDIQDQSKKIQELEESNQFLGKLIAGIFLMLGILVLILSKQSDKQEKRIDKLLRDNPELIPKKN